jgi:uncharacterized protein YkuJ
MIKRIVLTSMIILTQTAYAEDINKIFGLELGSVVNKEQSNFIRDMPEENKAIYGIDFKGFKKAEVEYTPTSKKIYNITTTKKTDKYCPDELDIVAGILSKKYGELKKEDGLMKDYYTIESGDKLLTTSCSGGLLDDSIRINLDDDSIKEMGTKEQIEIESSKELGNL